MNPPDPAPSAASPTVLPAEGHRRRRIVLPLVAVLFATGGGAAVWLGSSSDTSRPMAASAPAPVATPVLALPALAKGTVPWDQPLVVSVADGTLQAVTATGPDGQPVPGSMSGSTRWVSGETLLPSTAYALSVVVEDGAGRTSTQTLATRTAAPTRVLSATLSPRAGTEAGIGLPVILRLDKELKTQAEKAAVERRLSVTTAPAVQGAWRWMSDSELHYRGATFWKPGTTISVRADLDQLLLPGGTFGKGVRETSFTIGRALVGTVDVKAKTMTVTRDGKVVKVMKASMGKPGYDTRGGTHVVLERFEDKIMDAATLGTPRGSADYYRTAVKHAVRITNSGTFTHGAPWSVKSQGIRNVSHGCINLSPADAKWFHDTSRRGDVVNVINAVKGPRLYDAGTQDWNLSFEEWKKGSALA